MNWKCEILHTHLLKGWMLLHEEVLGITRMTFLIAWVSYSADLVFIYTVFCVYKEINDDSSSLVHARYILGTRIVLYLSLKGI